MPITRMHLTSTPTQDRAGVSGEMSVGEHGAIIDQSCPNGANP